MNDKPEDPVIRIKQAHGESVFSVDVRDSFTAVVDMWGDPKVRQYYYVWLRGGFVEGDEVKHETRLIYKDMLNSRDVAAGAIEVKVDRGKFEKLQNQGPFNILFGVHPEINYDDENGARRFKPGYRYLFVKDFYKDQTSFTGENRNGWLPGSEVNPGMDFAEVERKTCLRYRTKEGEIRKELLYKEFTNLVVGRRYYFNASVYAPSDPRQGGILSLEEGKKYAVSWNLAYQFQKGLFPVGGGITASGPEVRLSFFYNGRGTKGGCDIHLSDIALYEFSEGGDWDEEWDKEYEKDKGELPPVKEEENKNSDD